MLWRTTIGILTLALLALPGKAAAQDVATSLDELLQSGELRRGDGVYVTNAAGRRIKSRISDASPSILKFTDGRDTWTFAASEVSKIERQDPVATGSWLGIGVAVATTYAV